MSKVDFKLNLPGLNQLMRGAEMQGVLKEKGAEVMSRAYSMSQIPGSEYNMDTKPIRWIAVTNVRAGNYEARKDNYENNTLLKALRGGG